MLLGVASIALACAGGSGSKGGSGKVADTTQFPSPEQLEELGSTPPPARLSVLDVRPVDSWELAGHFPERIAVEPWSDAGSPWSSLLDEAARKRVGLVVPTQAMHCVARELGRFFLAHGGQPTTSLRQFITSRCNASVAQIGFQYVEGELSPELGEAELFSHWKPAVADAIQRGLRGGPQTAGIWFGREGPRSVAMVAFGRRELHLEPLAPASLRDGILELRGETLGPGDAVQGLVNHGRFGVRECEQVDGATPPSFHLRCRVDPDDDSTLVSVSIHPPARLLGRSGLVVLAWPGGRTTAVYRRPIYAESWPMLDDQNFAEGFVELLNRVRKEAGLDPLLLDPRQSETATELAPHFFASAYGQSDELVAEVIVLGLLAGWTVDGIVQMGHFASAWSLRTTDLSDLLATALEFPSGRETLFAEDVQRIAIGPLLTTEEGHESVAGVFATYSMFSEKSHDAMARRVIEKLEAERKRRGVGPPERISDVSSLCQRVASSVQAGVEPRDALDGLLQQSVDLLQRPVAGWIAEVSEIESLEFPEEYLLRPSMGIAVAVSHRRPKGDAWGRYVVMLVIADPESHGI
ncbi:MAG: hypothetical protein E4H11_05065 [Myxococcales bacterium]|nr:MAG: hypothetical protein E4H11_05065 [Myxococcales bacterium]